MSEIVNRMKAIMEENGVKAKQVTTELGISNSSFTDWSKGKGSPSVDALRKFSDYFNVSLDYLVRGEEFRNKSTLEFSNPRCRELLDKFNQLTPELQIKLIGYVEGMISLLPGNNSENKKLSV